ncbi:uncharacterized protein LAESUDRAFT_653999 [Laetiporus sulphureus 93-53]|uniref:C3H1-type domain-containing protein n=1 Tax=Laetiporus sulphureus 93-53 TaxID=1314785 RepID=A0A165E6N1_9APHY|nr:uncharacterized protein LAESUDRAFT_653999 [Laetiporus sulphureus 93-53]KZT06341.1 hypothetical protein LAESUDRAFT_653999 [Laetiporus sulphureus 93-53]
MLSPANGESRWRFNGNGQLVDSATASWDLAEEIGKMHIGANGDGDAQIHTPPPSKTNIAHFHETSPLETSSEASLESGSSNALDHPINLASHSRESSADTSISAASSASQTLRGSPVTPLRIGAVGEARNRPHSYSGGISAADLTRLQQADGSPPNKGDSWSSPNGTPERQPVADQPTYPSLTLQTSAARPQEHQQVIQGFPVPRGDEFSAEYQLAQRQFGAMHQVPGMNSAAAGTAYAQGRPGGVPSNAATNIPYRQAPRGFTPQLPTVLQSPTNFGYPAPPPPPMSLNNAQQQLYEIMLPTPPLDNPAMARLQQQHNVFRGAHQHSPSDPASVRDPAALALINNNMQAFAASQMYPPALAPPAAALSMFASQFYGAPQDAYPSPELAAVQMMVRLQSQYTGPYSLPIAGQNVGVANPANASTLSGNTGTNTGPSANNRKLGLYKTELCRSWEEKGSCRYGAKCQFAHGEEELRKVTRHPKYKTEICRTFWVSGSCPYGKRCCFIHTELPASGAPPGADGAPPPQNPSGRDRSPSTNSDPNEVPTSLLARITAKRTQEGSINSNTGSVSTTPPSGGFQLGGRPGSLHVDTSVVNPAASSKQNKSAYPTFAHNGMLMPASEEVTARSPGPVTAGPDFGRHSSSRLDIVGTQVGRIGKNTGTNSNVRHSFNGSDLQLDFSTTPTVANMSSQLGNSDANKGASRINGHARSGSTGNWGNTARGSHLTAYPLSSIPGGELKASSPWAEFSVGSRLAEKNWV